MKRATNIIHPSIATLLLIAATVTSFAAMARAAAVAANNGITIVLVHGANWRIRSTR